MDASGCATEGQVAACLRYFYEARGLRLGTKHGPWSLAWFPTAVRDYFRQKRKQSDGAGPVGVSRSEWNEANGGRERFDGMIEAIE